MKKSILLVGVFTLMLTLSGCLETAEVTFFEPGIYKGAADPLLGNSDATVLQSRFERQRDR